jgi:CheY-like chemotaxis protein
MGCEFVLVVDDDDDVRESIENLLELDGHEVVAVSNGEQAIGALAVCTPTVVVTDLEMPIRGGLSLIEHIRHDERTQTLPVCVVSADASAAPQGTLFVAKPFAVSELRDALRRALHRDV